MQELALFIGRGPSLVGSKNGAWIDMQKYVVRPARYKHDIDCGYRADYIIVTSLALKRIARTHLQNVKEIWLYRTNRAHKKFTNEPTYKYPDVVKEKTGFNGDVYFVNNNIQKWLKLYKDNCTPTPTKPRCKHPSQGTAAILKMIQYLDVSTICLVGCDHVAAGVWFKEAYHDFNVEKKLILEYAKEAGKEIVTLGPDRQFHVLQ